MTDLQQVLSEIQALRADLRVSRHQLLTVDEAAERLGMATKTLRNKISSGNAPVKAVRSAGGVRFRAVDVQAYIDALGCGS